MSEIRIPDLKTALNCIDMLIKSHEFDEHEEKLFREDVRHSFMMIRGAVNTRAQHPTAGDGDVKKRRDIALKGLTILRQASYGEDITITAKDKAYRDVRTYIHLSAFEQAEHPAPPCEALAIIDKIERIVGGALIDRETGEQFSVSELDTIRTALLTKPDVGGQEYDYKDILEQLNVWVLHDLIEEDHQRNNAVQWIKNNEKAIRSALSRPSVEAREIVELIDFLRKEEGSSVEILCDNPDFDGPANAIVLCNEHTGWINKRYSGDSVLDALRNAKQDIIHDKYVVVGKK